MKINKITNTTVLGEKTKFEGNLRFSDELHIAGYFHGSINATGALQILTQSECRVERINASDVIVSGTVRGPIFAKEKIEMKAGCSVYGDISAARIKIDDDVLFEGSVQMTENSEIAERDIFSLPGEELKEKVRESLRRG